MNDITHFPICGILFPLPYLPNTHGQVIGLFQPRRLPEYQMSVPQQQNTTFPSSNDGESNLYFVSHTPHVSDPTSRGVSHPHRVMAM